LPRTEQRSKLPKKGPLCRVPGPFMPEPVFQSDPTAPYIGRTLPWLTHQFSPIRLPPALGPTSFARVYSGEGYGRVPPPCLVDFFCFMRGLCPWVWSYRNRPRLSSLVPPLPNHSGTKSPPGVFLPRTIPPGTPSSASWNIVSRWKRASNALFRCLRPWASWPHIHRPPRIIHSEWMSRFGISFRLKKRESFWAEKRGNGLRTTSPTE